MRRLLIVVSLVLAGLFVHPVGSSAGELEVITGGITTHIVAPGETLTSIAARFGVDPSTIVSDNRLAAGQPLEPGRTLRIDNRHIVPAPIVAGEIVVNVPQRMLFYRDERTGRWRTRSRSGARRGRRRQGPFTVIRKEEDPAWHVPASIRAESARKGQPLPLVVPPGPRNPLGRFWIGLSLAGIGIHGTPFASSIYQAATHGCIRLQRDGSPTCTRASTLGTRGRIIYEPMLMAESG